MKKKKKNTKQCSILFQKKELRAKGVAQLAGCMDRIYEVLVSVHSTAQNLGMVIHD